MNINLDKTMTSNLSTQAKENFFNEFLDEFLHPSFGSLPKKEIELLVFRLLIDARYFGENPSMQTISRELRIPLSKVKTIYYEMQLRTVNYTDESFRHDVLVKLQNARIYKVDKKIKIEVGIDDPLLRNEIEARLKVLGDFPDYSFNREIIRFDVVTYALFVEKFMDEEQLIELKNKILSESKVVDKSVSYTFIDLVNIFLSEFFKEAGKDSAKNIVDLSWGLITGGITTVISLARQSN
jgi:hypothetical protein